MKPKDSLISVENAELDKCKACGFCRISCPAAIAGDQLESISPRGKMLLLAGVSRDDLKPTPRIAEKIFTCVLCARCTLECPGGVEVHKTLIDARKAFNDYAPPQVKLLKDNLVASGNPFGLIAKKGSRTSKLWKNKRGDTMLFATCGYRYMQYGEALTSVLHSMGRHGLPYREIVNLTRKTGNLGRSLAASYSTLTAGGGEIYTRALNGAIEVLKDLGIETNPIFGEEPCCGYPLYVWGFEDEFSEHAKKVYKTLKSTGVERLIVLTPACAEAFRDVYPKYVDSYDLEVVHFVEVVKNAVDKGRIKFRLEEPLKITFHDPCQLARYLKISSHIRDILESIEGLTVLEAKPNTGLMTRCCGGGATYEIVNPAFSARMAAERTKELLETGADLIVTCCPSCLMNLQRGVEELKADVGVVDLAEILYGALPTNKRD